MDFTREPIIESVITPKEGCKLVVRSSKGAGQEEYFVDSVEVVSFGNTFFLRSLERPKSFLVPATDYEILEVRETRMVLKNVGLDRSIKIGGGREAGKRAAKEVAKKEKPTKKAAAAAETKAEPKRRERRRPYRRRRGKEETPAEKGKVDTFDIYEEGVGGATEPLTSRSRVIPPPSVLISESIGKYKDDELFRDVFYTKTEEEGQGEPNEISEGEVGTTNLFVEEPEEITIEVEESQTAEEVETEPEEKKATDDPLEESNSLPGF